MGFSFDPHARTCFCLKYMPKAKKRCNWKWKKAIKWPLIYGNGVDIQIEFPATRDIGKTDDRGCWKTRKRGRFQSERLESSLSFMPAQSDHLTAHACKEWRASSFLWNRWSNFSFLLSFFAIGLSCQKQLGTLPRRQRGCFRQVFAPFGYFTIFVPSQRADNSLSTQLTKDTRASSWEHHKGGLDENGSENWHR